MSRSTFSIVMPGKMRSYVDRRLKGGSFGNVSEYFRHLVREDQKREAQDRLETLLLEGEASGPGIVVDDDYWTKSRASMLAKARRAKRTTRS